MNVFWLLFFIYREIELLKKKTAQQKTVEETEASNKEETEQLQDKVKWRFL